MSSPGAENPELAFENLAPCAGHADAPGVIHDLFERSVAAIEVVVDWLTVVLAV